MAARKKLVNLARILLKKPDLLLLDEPDNHLDLEAKVWLEGFIHSYPGSVLIISHDRYLLEHVVKKIFELEDGQISIYVGNYSYFVEESDSVACSSVRRPIASTGRDKAAGGHPAQPQFVGQAKPQVCPSRRSMEKRVERARREAAERPVLLRDRIKVTFDSERSG